MVIASHVVGMVRKATAKLRKFFEVAKLFVKKMSQGHDGMIKHQSRPGKAHDLSDFLAHFGFIAVYGAFLTRGFVRAEFAAFEAFEGVGLQVLAFGAECFAAVVFAAVEGDHGGEGLGFAREHCGEKLVKHEVLEDFHARKIFADVGDDSRFVRGVGGIVAGEVMGVEFEVLRQIDSPFVMEFLRDDDEGVEAVLIDGVFDGLYRAEPLSVEEDVVCVDAAGDE